MMKTVRGWTFFFGLPFVLSLASAGSAATFDGLLTGHESPDGNAMESVLVVSPEREPLDRPGPNAWSPFADPPAHASASYASAAPASSAPCQSVEISRLLCGGCDRWAFEVDGLLLWQGNVPSRPVLENDLGQTVLDVNEAGTLTAAGPRYRLAFDIDPCRSIEGTFFRVESFAGEEATQSGTPVDLPISSPLSPATLLTQARFQSAEVNLRHYNGGMITWLAGFRWVEWAQQMQLADDTQGVTGLAGNDLYGGQIGADLLLWNAGTRFRVNGIGKAGIYGNRAYQRTSGIPTGGPAGANGTGVSFFGETALVADVGITSWLTWRTGYVVFWGTGLALPAENLSLVNFDPPASAGINISESLLVHGVTTGLEARW